MPKRSLAKRCIDFCSLYEAELLIELMLRFWKHPFASDSDFRNDLLESAVEVLTAAARGTSLFAEIPAQQVNFVNAVWYAEWNAVSAGKTDQAAKRNAWLSAVRSAVPSCFCPQDRLGQ